MDGRHLKRLNAAISLSFLVPALFFALKHPVNPIHWLIFFAAGLVWANWFEYVYHRWVDHVPGTPFEAGHRKHHAKPSDEGHINLGDTGWTTLGMFLVNSIPLYFLDRWLQMGFTGPVLASFVTYVIAIEEIHWRIHTGSGWVPGWARAYHLRHHDRPLEKYNICFPIFDGLFHTK